MHGWPSQTHRGLSLKGGKRTGFVTPTETNLHGDALCFMVKTWARQKTTEALLNSGWRLRRLVVGGGWRLVVPRGCPEGLSLTKIKEFVGTALHTYTHTHTPNHLSVAVSLPPAFNGYLTVAPAVYSREELGRLHRLGRSRDLGGGLEARRI